MVALQTDWYLRKTEETPVLCRSGLVKRLQLSAVHRRAGAKELARQWVSKVRAGFGGFVSEHRHWC